MYDKKKFGGKLPMDGVNRTSCGSCHWPSYLTIHAEASISENTAVHCSSLLARLGSSDRSVCRRWSRSLCEKLCCMTLIRLPAGMVNRDVGRQPGNILRFWDYFHKTAGQNYYYVWSKFWLWHNCSVLGIKI